MEWFLANSGSFSPIGLPALGELFEVSWASTGYARPNCIATTASHTARIEKAPPQKPNSKQAPF